MKKFTDIDNTFENRKFKEESKNKIYDIIKENIHISIDGNGNIEGDIEIDLKGVIESVEKIDEYINGIKLTEKANTLKLIKTIASTGTLNMQRINEEINSCECSETCPLDEIEEEELPTAEFDDTYYEEQEGDEEIDVLENVNLLADEFIKLVETGEAEKTGWNIFFDRNNVPEDHRTNTTVDEIQKIALDKKPDLFG